ncbi:uncharacterized protein LOC110253659 isoform X2 [Exaiptasia diaphana]|uniref:Receptor ligand binding region domain-containing protein n=1 Tax=Exaiptasia diaphana TaxID=2652724 RepID=A0A913Y820_EXADI|nr:uncharacterized protein LOC110253659 isoform X2 [Exaiptasia diaphana]
MENLVLVIFLLAVVFPTDANNVTNPNGSQSSPKKIKIKLGFIAPLDSSLGATSTLGKELESAFKIAIEVVNKHEAKGNVELSTDFTKLVKDGGSDPPTTCKIAAQQLADDPEIVGVVGGYRSSCSIASHQYFRDHADSMTQISYGSTSPKLSNKKIFPKFFRTCASDVYQASALADLVNYFNWKRVSTITSTDVSAKDLTDRFESQAKLKGIRVHTSSRFSAGAQPDTIDRKVQLIKDAHTRVNLVSALPQNAQTVFQKAKAKGMMGQGWVWIGTDGVTSTPLSNATKPEIKQSMQGAIGIRPSAGSKRAFLHIIVKWMAKLNNRTQYPGVIYDTLKTDKPLRTSAYVPHVYDAVYTYFLAFDRLEKAGKIKAGDSPSKLRRLVFEELKQFTKPENSYLSAQGFYTHFDKNFDGQPAYDVVNLQGIVWKRVATWNKTMGIERLNHPIIWPGNTKIPPTDKGLPGKTTFRIGFIAPTDPNLAGLAQLGKELQMALNVAVDMMNKDLSLSVDFDVKVQEVGTDAASDCKTAADRLAKDDVVAVIGAYRSECSAAAAKVLGSSSHKVPQISYGSTSPRLSDKTKYKYFFRTSASDVHQARAISAFFRTYRWPEVGIVSTSDSYGGDLASDFKKEVEGMSDMPVRVVSIQKFPVNGRANVVRPKVDKLKSAGTKVNLISMVRNDAETVFQQIRELGMTGKGWVWLASDGATTSTFDKQKDLETAMQGMLGIQPKKGEGPLFLRFLAAWMDNGQPLYTGTNQSPSSSPFMAQLFDAVHGVALALSDLVNKKQISRSTNVMKVREKLYKKLKTFDDPSSGYPSATGKKNIMYFDQRLDGPPRYDVVNLQDSGWITVGHYDEKTQDIRISRDPIFPGGTTIPVVGVGRPTYKIAAFFPLHNDLGSLAELGREWEAAFKLSVGLANADPSFKVAFSYIIVDGGPNVDSCFKAAKNLPDDIDLIIGEARSACSIAISKATRSRKIPQMSYASTSSQLSDKQAYPHFFRTCSADNHQATALAKLVIRYGLERVGTIATTDNYADDLVRKFALDVRRTGRVEITAEERFNLHTKHAVKEEVTSLKQSGAVVNLISSTTDDAEKVFQEAIEQGMTGKGWAWLGTDGSTSSTFINAPNLRLAMQGMVGTRPRAGSGQLYQKLLNIWDEKDSSLYPGLLHSSRIKETSVYVAQVQDTILAYANALTSLHEAKTINKLTPRPTMQRELVEELKKMKDTQTGFTSSVGDKIFFDSNQDGPAEYDLVNLNGNSWVRVGRYSPSKGLSVRRKIVWPGGILTPPSTPNKDPTKTSQSAQTSSVSTSGLVALGVIFGIFAIAMIGFIGFLIHRERKGYPTFASNVFTRTNGSPVNEISVAIDGAASACNGGVITKSEKSQVLV